MMLQGVFQGAPDAAIPATVAERHPSSMLSVLRHYLPIRKALLIVSETAILTLCLATWLSAHLWSPAEDVQKLLLRAIPALTAHDAILRCVTTSFFLALIAQIAIAFNELYDVRISSSFHDRAARFVESA